MMSFDWGLEQTLQNGAEATGNGEDLLVNNYGAASIAISGTFVGTVTFEASANGVDYFAIKGLNRTSEASATTATATGLFYIALPGIARVRARISAYTSGEITVKGIAVPLLASPNVFP